jgi:GNAT superfamily N-acetyltransferase
VDCELRPVELGELLAARDLLARACEYDRAAAVAEEKLFGEAAGLPWRQTLGAFRDQQLLGLSVVSGRWLRLLAVDPSARGAGVGSALLAAAERSAADAGETHLRALDQPGNYLAPGIAVENTRTIEWLLRRGWAAGRRNTNLLIDVERNARATAEHAGALGERACGKGYRLRRAALSDLPVILPAVAAEFSRGWAFEVEQAIRHPPGAVHLAWSGLGALVAFAAHDGNNRGLGWFGPAGTWPDHRGKGLAEALLVACLADVAAAGHRTCTISWIGPRAFYERCAGINGEQHFLVMTKELSPK